MASGGRASARITVSARAWLCLSFVLIACRQEAPPPITIALNPWIGYEYLHIAARQGFFAEEGVQVRLVEFGSINDVGRAFERGEVEAFGCSPVELLHAVEHGTRPLKVFQVLDFSDGADVVIARKPIADVARLRGARVAVEPSTVTMFLLYRALESVGLTLDDVTLVQSDQLQMLEVFVAGKVDAVVSFPPVSSQVLETGQGNRVYGSERVPGEIVDMLAMDATLLKQRPDAAAAIVRAFGRAVAYVEANPADAYAAMAGRLGMKTEEVAALVAKGVHMIPLAEQEAFFTADGPLVKSLRTNVEILRRTGELSRAIDIDSLIEDEPLRRALDASRATKRAPRPDR